MCRKQVSRVSQKRRGNRTFASLVENGQHFFLREAGNSAPIYTLGVATGRRLVHVNEGWCLVV
ncbi:hypothetical protein CMEL01_10806 [Colletotrichum melonis]|uniref:Uncharacterized protein n=1 Tax=Colletotrichum melonis TaxID=1209925 RepID=A0AAI9UXX8_9PEZI|nr:hypothetical protein CMEL01_10806 [Colletotrichum melonis]